MSWPPNDARAAAYRAAFFRAYPKLAAWHRRQGDGVTATRTLAGRRRKSVAKFAEKLNAPVQGSGADGLKAALALPWERRHERPTAVPVLAVHDEIVVECDASDADAVTAWLVTAMTDGMAPLCHPHPRRRRNRHCPDVGRMTEQGHRFRTGPRADRSADTP